MAEFRELLNTVTSMHDPLVITVKVFFLPPPPLDGMPVPHRVTPGQQYVHQYPFMHLDGERHSESKMSCS